MKKLFAINRLVISSFVLLVLGIVSICKNMNGSTGFDVAYPVAATSLKILITSTGGFALFGVVAIIVGVALLILACVFSIAEEFESTEH